MMVGAGDDHLAGFQRLPERIEGRLRNFRQLVKKQNTAMRQRNLAGARPCRGDLQHPACCFLPAKIGHVGKIPA